MGWYLHACPVCGGDLYDSPEDDDQLTCLMCARSFFAAAVLAAEAPDIWAVAGRTPRAAGRRRRPAADRQSVAPGKAA